MKAALLVCPPKLADTLTAVVRVTEVVVILNVALVLPPGTVTVAGTLTAAELSLRDTIIPLLGAGLDNVTVAIDMPPPRTLVGFNERELNVGGVTVKVEVFVSPP